MDMGNLRRMCQTEMNKRKNETNLFCAAGDALEDISPWKVAREGEGRGGEGKLDTESELSSSDSAVGTVLLRLPRLRRRSLS